MSVKNLKYSSLENSIAESQDQKKFDCQFLVIAGGGSGARGGNGYGGSQGNGGGGAGGYICSVPGENSGGNTSAVQPLEIELGKDYQVKVGAGASNVYGSFGTGDVSIFDSVIAAPGGGGGGQGFTNDFRAGGRGGSAGGSGSQIANNRHYPNQGGPQGQIATGGGGGGASANDNSRGGGDGISSSITGAAVIRAGGGAGVLQSQFTINTGGDGGGGNTGNQYSQGGTGTVNTGSGGGVGGNGNGNSNRGDGGLGGSGIVILRYPAKYTISVGAGLTAGSETAVGDNEKYIEITAGSDNVSWS